MNTFLHDLIDPGANWCPVCGEPRGVCACDESDFMPEAADDWDEIEDYTCEYCDGTGGNKWDDGISPCPHCDGEGRKWWLP